MIKINYNFQKSINDNYVKVKLSYNDAINNDIHLLIDKNNEVSKMKINNTNKHYETIMNMMLQNKQNSIQKYLFNKIKSAILI